MRPPLRVIGIFVIIATSAGCGKMKAASAPTSQPSASMPVQSPASLTAQPSPTPARPAEQPEIFTHLKTVAVTPAGNFQKASFTRVGYVPGRDAMIVTFDTVLEKPEGECGDKAYGYREFNLDMVETGDRGIINCYGGIIDSGGLFVGDDFYYAFQAGAGNTEGWILAKYNAVTWEATVPEAFFGLPHGYNNGDPMMAVVNGQIDVSSKIMTDPSDPGDCPFMHCWTHHEFFTKDLVYVETRVLKDAYNVNLSSLVQTEDGVVHFVTADSYGGNAIVMRYDRDWKYLGVKTILEKAGADEGVAFDGNRFYVSYVDFSGTMPNVHLAAFDKDWNFLDDIAVTSFTSQNPKAAIRPSLTLYRGRIYVCYDQDEHPSSTPAGIENEDIQVYVGVYEVKT
jgi:hypothetical protein